MTSLHGLKLSKAHERRDKRRMDVLAAALDGAPNQYSIAEELEVDQKTVSNDIRWLCDQGLLVREPRGDGWGAGYTYREGPNLPANYLGEETA